MLNARVSTFQKSKSIQHVVIGRNEQDVEALQISSWYVASCDKPQRERDGVTKSKRERDGVTKVKIWRNTLTRKFA